VEKAELAVIEEFLPQQMGEDEVKRRDRDHQGRNRRHLGQGHGQGHGRTEGAPRQRQLDMSKASGLVKAALG
jgi:uncharacterized protein YqeY